MKDNQDNPSPEFALFMSLLAGVVVWGCMWYLVHLLMQ